MFIEQLIRQVIPGILLLYCAAPSEVFARSGDNIGADVPATANTIGKYAGGLNLVARMTDVAMSPGGRLIALSQEEPVAGTAVTSSFRLLVSSTACLASSNFANQCFITIEGLSGVRRLGWSVDGLTLFLVENRDTVVALRFIPGARLRAVIEGREIIGRNIGDTLVISGAIPGRNFTQSMQWISRRLTGAPSTATSGDKRLVQIIGSHVAVIADYDQDLVLRTHLEKRSIEFPLSRSYLESVDVGADANDRPILAGKGWAFRLIGSRWTAIASPKFSRQLFSPIDGRSVGSYSLTEVTSVRRSDRPILRKISAGGNGSILISAATDGQGSYAILRKDALGALSIALCANGGGAIRYGQSTVSTSTIGMLELGDKSRPLGIVEERPLLPKGVAVFFQGGPVGDAGDVVDARFPKLYFARGWAVVSIVYSGTGGFDLGTLQRLKSGGVAAIANDAYIVARYLDQAYPNLPVIVHGESFGAIGALALESRLTRRQGGLVAIVPYLRSRPPSEWAIKKGLLATNPDYQTRWERAVIGIDGEASRRNFNESLAALSLSRDPSRSALFVFSSTDLASRPEDIPPIYRADSQVLTFRDPHAFILAEPGITAAVNTLMDRGFATEQAVSNPIVPKQ